MYQAGSELAVSSSEVQEFTKNLKQRKPSAEQVQERVKKAERALARYSAGESWRFSLPWKYCVNLTIHGLIGLREENKAHTRWARDPVIVQWSF